MIEKSESFVFSVIGLSDLQLYKKESETVLYKLLWEGDGSNP